MTTMTVRTRVERRAMTSVAVLGLGTMLLTACAGAPPSAGASPSASPGPTSLRSATSSVETASLTGSAARTPSTSLTTNRAQTSTESPKDEITAPYTNGWKPKEWISSEGRLGSVRCGMPVAELEALAESSVLDVEVTGDLGPSTRWHGWDLPVDVTLATAAGIPTVAWEPTLVWSQAGVVVDLGGARAHGNNGLLSGALAEDSVWSGAAWVSNASSCRPETIVEPQGYPYEDYDNERAGGTFEVRALSRYAENSDGEIRLALSDPVTVTLDSGVGAPLPGTDPEWTDPEVPPYGQGWQEGKPALYLLGIECLDHESSFVTADQQYGLELTGSVSGPYWDWRAPARLVSKTGAPAPEWGQPVLLLLRADGRLAGVGYDPTMAWSRVAAGTDTAEATAMSGVTTMCRQHSGGPFEPNHAPAGDYFVRAMTEVPPRDFETKRQLVFSDPVPVTLDANGTIARR